MAEEIRNFRLGELIATGGMAAIYKGVQISLNRPVAIKILHPHLARDENFILRFEREAKAAASLQHENIISIIDFGKEGDRYFLAMEYVDGPSLKELLESGVIPIEIALYILNEILKGIDYAHEKGVIHRDLKPGNILIDKRGSVKIGDFGLAKAQDTATVTVTGSIVGTPAYMSPEQASGAMVDSRSDLFSIGVIGYEMITGAKPFPGETYSMVINNLISKEPKPISSYLEHIPRRMESIIHRLLRKDPDQRYQKASEVIDEIKHLTQDTSITLDQRNLVAYINQREEYLKEIRKQQIETFFNRGLHYVNLGMAKIDNALDQFSLVLLLDPENEKARKIYEELKQKKEHLKKEPPKPVRKKSKLRYLVPVGIVLFLSIIAFLAFQFGQPFLRIIKRVKYASLHIETEPAGATLTIDTIKLKSPADLESLQPGSYKIGVSLKGYKPMTFEKEITGQDTIYIQLTPFPALLSITTPSGARLMIDEVEREPGEIELQPGTHRIVVKGDNVSYDRKITLAPAETVRIRVTATPVNPVVFVRSKPQAVLWIDGRRLGLTPKGPLHLSPGSHRFLLTRSGFVPVQKTVRLKSNDTLSFNIRLIPARRRRK
ncbi:hypothetical protein DRP53_10250 [candidate division WOR-3 bacterium]|uniref:non-specific serine/threonine protein kinase n=1 Tax=candidate division WOR-3 bacterium TaxID=2052148 RepID=A0A660SDD8_UNCW3|nr:MAG: hypothetical protein DRP53_10250 [candidate division WOR-3 bacterium]